MINEYEFNYEHLISKDFPRYTDELQAVMKQPFAMELFSRKGVGVKSLIKLLDIGKSNDIKGCYVFLDGDLPVYVGISKCVFGRLMQHVRGTTHFDASLAYRMAKEKAKFTEKTTRSNAMKDEKFRAIFECEKEYIKNLNVAFVEIDNAFALYCFEPYCALMLGTAKWNTFETH